MNNILNNAINLKLSDGQVSAAYLNDVRVWPPGVGLWAFNIPPNGSELALRLRSNDNSDIQLNWGDTTTDDTLTSGAITPHVYNFDNDLSTWTGAISVSQPEKITVYDARNTSDNGWLKDQPFFGKTDISVLPNLRYFHIENHSTEVVGFETLTNVLQFRNVNNNSTGKLLENISNKPSLNVYNIIKTKYNGPVHSSLPNPGFVRYVVSENKLTGTLPEFDENFNGKELEYYWVNKNSLSGDIPTLSGIGIDYNYSRQLQRFDFSSNNFSGLRDFDNWTVTNNVSQLWFSGNNLPTTALDKIIIEVDTKNPNQSPVHPTNGQTSYIRLQSNPGVVSQSVIDTNISSLTAKGWTVFTPLATYPGQ